MRVLPHQPLGPVRIARLQRGDDVAMIGDRALRAVVLRHRHRAHRTHVDEQVVGQAGHQPDAAHADDRLVELPCWRREYSLICPVGSSSNASTSARSSGISAGVTPRRGQPRGHALDRRPDGDHLDHLALGLAHHDHAAPRHRADEPLLLQHRQRLADRRAADAEVLRQLPFVQADLAGMAVDVHFGDGALDRVAGLLAQADADLQRLDLQARRNGVVRHPALLTSCAYCIWYATAWQGPRSRQCGRPNAGEGRGPDGLMRAH